MAAPAIYWPETDAAPLALWPDEPDRANEPRAFGAWLPVVTPAYRWDWPHLRLMQHRLERVTAGESDREMFFLPPRHGKTEQNTVRYIAYRLERQPTLRVILGAYNATLARKFSRRIRKIARDRIALSTERTAVEDWETAAGGGVRAVGVGDGVTGQGGDLIVIDDPVKSRAEANSEAYRERVWEWYTQDLYTRLEPGGQILLTMTRWHEDDLAGRILDSPDAANWHRTVLPALADPDLTGGRDPLGRAEGEALCPDRYTRADLLAISAVTEAWAFEALYQQRPTAKKGEVFDPAWFTIVDAAPAVADRVRGWDQAATSGDGDWTAGCRMSRTPDGRYFIEHITRGRWAPGDRDRTIRQTAELDGRAVQQWGEQEPGASGKSAALAFVSLLAGFTARTEPSSGDKIVRAGPLAAQAQVGNVALVRGEWNAAFLEELRQFPQGKHDDQVDAASLAFNALARPRPQSRPLLSQSYQTI